VPPAFTLAPRRPALALPSRPGPVPSPWSPAVPLIPCQQGPPACPPPGPRPPCPHGCLTLSRTSALTKTAFPHRSPGCAAMTSTSSPSRCQPEDRADRADELAAW